MNTCSVNNKDNVIEKTGYFRIKSILLGGLGKTYIDIHIGLF
nr:MAG TPA: hypothetical protein [Caudoviricetes sp.]DAV87775.1 MAG TPA: hypothetical protein [Caudoviricetes sp.]